MTEYRGRGVRGALRGFALGCVSMAIAACSPVALLNATVPTDGRRIVRDVAYGPHPRQAMDIHLPARPADGPAPVIVFFYGGRWESGRKEHYHFVGQALASKGMVAVIADYRLFPEVRFPTFMKDAAEAVAWVAANIGRYGGDPSSLYVMGHSAGAHIATLVALDESYLAEAGAPSGIVQGVIGLAGPYDFLPLDQWGLTDIFDTRAVDPLTTQPLSYADADAPPMLLATGEEDGTVKPRNTRALAAALEEAGNRVETRFYPDVGHVGIVVALAPLFRGRAPVLEDIARFVR